MTKKQKVMKNDPKLFKGFCDAVERGEYLRMPVFLCDDAIELYTFEGKNRWEQSIKAGPIISSVVRYQDYSQENLDALNAALDARAAVLRERWLPEYKKLNDSYAGGFVIDLSLKDYAKLTEYSRRLEAGAYGWCYEGLLAAANHISHSLRPISED